MRRRSRRGFICNKKNANVCKLTRRSPNAVARRRIKPQFDGTHPVRVQLKILRGKPTRCRVIPGRPALLVWRGNTRPSRTAPLGMTTTPTLLICSLATDTTMHNRGGGGGGGGLIKDLKRQDTYSLHNLLGFRYLFRLSPNSLSPFAQLSTCNKRLSLSLWVRSGMERAYSIWTSECWTSIPIKDPARLM